MNKTKAVIYQLYLLIIIIITLLLSGSDCKWLVPAGEWGLWAAHFSLGAETAENLQQMANAPKLGSDNITLGKISAAGSMFAGRLLWSPKTKHSEIFSVI